MKITVVGTGYVGMSIGVLLAQQNDVIFYDIDESRIELIKDRKSPIDDTDITKFLNKKELNLRATANKEQAYAESDIVIVATPTNYDPITNYFDTSSVESVVSDVNRYNQQALIVIKSTIPIGFTEFINLKLPKKNVIFSPEFLREGRALHDNLYPSRIIVGEISARAETFANLLSDAAVSDTVPLLFTNSTEAEAIKLFANTFLAMRVSYFNELDTFAAVNNLDPEQIIKGVGMDPRIGSHYNNPSFGYGGYCLPKDTKQLLANFDDVPQNLISATVRSNETRIKFIASEVLKRKPKTVGIYRLIMKSGSDNFRTSSIQSVIKLLQDKKINLIIYEPNVSEDKFFMIPVLKDFNEFTQSADIIICNRWSPELAMVNEKVYTRDLFGND